MCFLPLISFSQKSNLANENSTINIIYNLKNYKKVANDSILKIYNMQLKSGMSDGISFLYKFSDLSLKSLPEYTIKKSASLFYDCEKDIENFIQFEDSNLYQNVIVSVKGKDLTVMTIPNPSTEMERVYNLKPGTLIDKSGYSSEVLQFFKVMPYKENEIMCYEERPENFFFGIYGIWGIFEVEKSSGVVYANIVAYENGKRLTQRMPINDFIRKYIGEDLIRALALGYYQDINGKDVFEGFPCKTTYEKPSSVVIKFKIID